MTIDTKELRKVIADCYWPTSPVTIKELLDHLEKVEKERDAAFEMIKRLIKVPLAIETVWYRNGFDILGEDLSSFLREIQTELDELK